jgi:CheY-like chemotaxis protein
MASVLIIGDGSDSDEQSAALLRELGHDAATADHLLGVAAVSGRPLDLVVLNGGMSLPDGLMALAFLRRHTGRGALPAILVSAAPTAEQVDRARGLGVRHVIDAARYTPGELAAAVADLLAG